MGDPPAPPVSTPAVPLAMHAGLVTAVSGAKVEFEPFDSAPVVGTEVVLTRSKLWRRGRSKPIEGRVANGVIAEVSLSKVVVDVTDDIVIKTIDGQRQSNFDVGEGAKLYWAAAASRADSLGESP